jgi:actin-related protein 9
MFPAEDGKTWEPYKIRPIKKPAASNNVDVEISGVAEGDAKKDAGEEPEYEEDPESDEGAVYPLQGERFISCHALYKLTIYI